MFFIRTKWHEENPNDWVVTDRYSHELIDRDDDLGALAKRVDEKGLKNEVVFGKNWFSPHHCAKENREGTLRCHLSNNRYNFMKYFLHLQTILIHKWYVGIECFKRGLYWQGIVHDLSKFGPTEFFTSAEFYQGDGSPIGFEKKMRGYSLAWLNHKAKNKHHWEYWTDFYDGVIKPVPIPEKYIKEMACDMIGANKTYMKERYHPNGAWEYFDQRRDKFIMTDDDKALLEKLLIDYTREYERD